MNHLDVAINCQIFFTILAIILNSILLYLILRHTKCNMGFYKYLLAGYSLFETLFAVIVFIGMPLHFVSDKTWLAFSYRGLLHGTPYEYLGPVMFCWFYEIWIAYSIGNFAYRYMIVCRETWVQKIKRNASIKILIVAGILLFVLYVTFCAFQLCTKPIISPKVINKLTEIYGIPDVNEIGYIAASFHDPAGHLDPWGTASAMTHYILIITSTTTVLFFCFAIWKGIKELQNKRREVDIKLEKQLFKVLLIQTTVPLLLSHLPCLINLTFPFWERDLNLGPLPPFFSVLTTLQKSIDPVIAMVYISDYKKAIRRILCKSNRIDDSTDSYRRTDPLAESTRIPQTNPLPPLQTQSVV